jgi:hypothetical protein
VKTRTQRHARWLRRHWQEFVIGKGHPALPPELQTRASRRLLSKIARITPFVFVRAPQETLDALHTVYILSPDVLASQRWNARLDFYADIEEERMRRRHAACC